MLEVEQLKKRIEELEQENRGLQHTMTELERSYDVTLEALGYTLDLKEDQILSHSRRVTAFAICIARAWESQQKLTRCGSLLVAHFYTTSAR
jgi:HD-GYP domain-containing protein (c-di-GMP phosphodiesterase class II)